MDALTTIETYEDYGLLTRERLGYTVFGAARRWPEREFMQFEHRRLSFRDIADWTLRVANDLVARGVHPGERILIQAPNRPEVAVLQLAAWRIGATAVPVIPVYREHELRHILADAQPSVVAATPQYGARSLCEELDGVLAEADICPVIKYQLAPGAALDTWSPLPELPVQRTENHHLSPRPARSSACHLILYTSGTTAAPKGAMLTGAGILSNCASMARTLGLNELDVFVAGSPIAHVAGMSMGVLLPMSLGARTILLPRWDADAAVEHIEREGATFMSSAPVFLSDLVERYEDGAASSHRLSIYMSGGAPTPPSLIRRAEAVGIKASRIYGMTETAGVCAMARADDLLELRAETDGRVIYGTELVIVSDNGRPVPPGELGEVRIRTPQLMNAYTDAVATERQVDRDGWFYPGDVGRVDATGWFTMVGRTKDIINRGGEKFSAQDIENAVASHPDVAAAAVIAVPDRRLGEVVAAVICLRPNSAWRGRAELLAHLERQHLAKQKLPAHWFVVDELPTTSTGKIRKQALSAMWAKGELVAAP